MTAFNFQLFVLLVVLLLFIHKTCLILIYLQKAT